MALAGCPDYFLRHSNYQEGMDRTSSRRPEELIVPGFQRSANQNFPHHHDDDVDLEQLVNEMNSSMESVYSTTDTALLLNNGHAHTPHHHHHHIHVAYPGHGQAHRRHTPPIPTSSPSRERLRHSQPMHIQAVRCLQEEQQLRPASLPAIPNPFPELCSPAGSPVLSPIQTSDNHIVKVWSEDGAGKVVEIPADMTARDVCQLLVYKSHCLDDNAWTLVEHHPILGLERCLEDHELVVQVQASMSSDSKFLFRKNYAKYEFFRNPLNFFPEQMVAWCQESDGSIPQSQLLQNFLNSSSCPEIQGYLYVKEPGRKSWKKLYMFLRRSGLYYSTKGTSKEPRHLQLLSDLEDSNIFTIITGRKLHNAPTDYQFCIKPSKVRSDCKELKMLCAEDEQSRTCWMTAFRLLKYGIVLYQSYNVPQQRKSNLSHFTAPVRSVSENSLVAMDFSGRTGRVIDNPVEAQSAALEEGQTWRKRSQRMNVLGSPSPLHPPSLSTVIHRTQVWFHGRIMREEAHKMIIQQGQVDGLFLLRDSQSNPKAFVLTMCHHQKIKHFQILPCEEDGQVFFSLDDGATKFTDLIHLVEFYQLNRGVLPCKLKHPCTAVAL
ncbi:growth factor receptor-bound protein 10-like isoform X1 [Thunnus albacares]|uniref:growth factor receptor-bound protein 10-like isoform X1 n=3 Tax=Thunnus albacares TaxID=8236 RepID=UPI001CF6A032|nr:growth factor receptor-bound protein 10-like isoform X1 [Thunnus albacares]XP_044191725.1 growth factor receptor-bound protein 10-like isoform X1 [Thunnus albacares]XP_044191726.1 growth factor receptor-bound protein 10-like isoform X1 [Thunnus albacares]XP_044191727.1 growth factor receptor-bound protein 10-like isoform X1 [Thunnus albacares]